ncbi:MAG TPA: hypothetical protein VIA62_22885 [Thermoanaerobaculia bacterium]|jgi:hypothetical protein|nr:hypothetical protein [Thermoanaerobaculia bacterium]
MRNAARAVLGLLATALALTPAMATTALERSETDLIQESAIIVTGHCTHLQSQWVDRTLVTIATISVSEVLKGRAGAEVTVVLPGGTDVHRRVPIAMTFPAAPQMYQQEEVLLFLTLEERVANGYTIVGFSQGKFTLADNGQGQKVASQNLSALNLQGRTGAVTRGRAKTLLLAELRQKIQETPAAERPR